MGLKNAFEEIATESILRRLIEQVRFAKDANDRLRVQVDNSPQITVVQNNSTTSIAGGPSPLVHTASTWNVVDAREPMRDQSLMAFQITRNRWSIT